ncbi:MAG: TonB-dependent receptor [Candidatus Zixiibacteriota bacterium]
MKRFLLLLLMTVLLSFTAAAAATVVTGTVVDTDNNPIANVTVRSGDIARPTQTNERGEFTISIDKPTAVTLMLSHTGYIPKSVKVSPSENAITVVMTAQVYPMQGITVTSGRAVEGKSPVAFAEVDREEIDKRMDIGEFPELLEATPNVYSYSDAGGGLGYSYMSIRGFNARRAPVYINGVPLNDPEDHALYFIDLPDFASYVDNIQVQRGVGNSLYGDPSFGGSVNILTSVFAHSQKAEIMSGYGGYLHDGKTVGLMRKQSIYYSTGMLDGGWSLSSRWVKQYSDGYRKHAWYDGSAYYLSLGHLSPNMITTLNIYGGPIKTHAAWDGIDRATMAEDRRANWYTYANETDNFNQPHFELHNIYTLNEHMNLNSTLYYIRGEGFYEQLRYGERAYDYLLTDDPDLYTDLARRKWVSKYQTGLNSHIEYGDAKRTAVLGGSYYFFESDHWGEVLWAEEMSPSNESLENPHRYYDYFGKYHNASAYASYQQTLTDKLSISGNLQLRYLHKDIHMPGNAVYPMTIYGLDWLFLSPRIGLNYQVNENVSSYFSFSISSHEPNDEMIDDADDPTDTPRLEVIDDSVSPVIYGDATVDAERLYDFELGTEYRTQSYAVGINLFWMEYRNALVPDGELNDDGFPTYGNADRSLHRGVELTAAYTVLPHLKLSGNYAYNDFRIKEYDQYISAHEVIERRDVATPNFPKYIANFNAEYEYSVFEVMYTLRAVGRQFISLDGRFVDVEGESVDISIEPYTVSSLKGIVHLGNIIAGADVTLEARVDNVFNKEYETFGYRWGDYFAYWPAAERNWFVNLKLSF